MTRFVALLRGVNVGGRNLVSMADLRSLTARLGLTEAESVMQSGNLIFTSTNAAASIERLLETETEKELGVKTAYFIRSAAEWSEIVEGNPFGEEAGRDPAHLAVMLLKDAPSQSDVEALRAAIVGRERVEVDGRTAYLVYPDGMGRSKLTTSLTDRKLRTPGTARNWNTVLKLLARVHSAA